MKATPLSCVGNFFTRAVIADVNANTLPAAGRWVWVAARTPVGGKKEDTFVSRFLFCVQNKSTLLLRVN